MCVRNKICKVTIGNLSLTENWKDLRYLNKYENDGKDLAPTHIVGRLLQRGENCVTSIYVFNYLFNKYLHHNK